MKRILGTFLILAIFAALIAAGYLFAFSRTPYGDHYREIHIPRGTPLLEILTTLEKEEIISNSDLFRLYLMIQGISSKVRAGDYEFQPKMTPRQIARKLLEGDFKIYHFTIPEGWTMSQIADYLERKQLTKRDEFLSWCYNAEWIRSLGIETDSLEGYLFPSTYETYYPEKPQSLIKLMVTTFQANFTDEMRSRAKQLGLTPHEVVTLASIVEKETGHPEERPLIASVFDNRLRQKIPLQSDPTVIYGIKDFDGNLTRRDLESFTPYNTYVIPGLPPGPIANPGKAALLAVLYPADTDYLYFVSKNNGSHVFSKTLKEHNRSVYKYQIKRGN
jgi:UPF0755 protein